MLDRLVSIDLPLAREILVVDDGSTDGTADALAAAVRDGLAVTVIRAERNGGKGSALRIGLARARGTIVAIQDADLELNPVRSGRSSPIVWRHARRVRLAVPRRRAERPLALGGRQPAAHLRHQRALRRVAHRHGDLLQEIMRADVAHSLRLEANRFDVEPQITARLLRAGHHVTELPVGFEARTRRQGKKIGWRDGVRALNVLVAERFRSAR